MRVLEVARILPEVTSNVQVMSVSESATSTTESSSESESGGASSGRRVRLLEDESVEWEVRWRDSGESRGHDIEGVVRRESVEVGRVEEETPCLVRCRECGRVGLDRGELGSVSCESGSGRRDDSAS